MMKRWLVLLSVVVLAGGLGSSVALAQDEDVTPEDVEAAFADLTRADIEAMGYTQETPCVDASELPASVLGELGIPATAGQGIHLINMALIDTTLDPLEPEVFTVGPDGEVWTVEYLTPPQDEPLELFGQQLSYVEAVDLDALHLWVIDNPAGQFADFNPSVSCSAVTAPPTTGTGGDLGGGSGLAGAGLIALLAGVAGIAGIALFFGGWTLRRRAR